MYNIKKLMKDYNSRTPIESILEFIKSLGFTQISYDKTFRRYEFKSNNIENLKLVFSFMMSGSDFTVKFNDKSLIFKTGIRQHLHYFRRSAINIFGKVYSDFSESFKETELREIESIIMKAITTEDDTVEEVESYHVLTD